MLPGCKEAVRLHQRQLQALGFDRFYCVAKYKSCPIILCAGAQACPKWEAAKNRVPNTTEPSLYGNVFETTLFTPTRVSTVVQDRSQADLEQAPAGPLAGGQISETCPCSSSVESRVYVDPPNVEMTPPPLCEKSRSGRMF